MVPETIVLSIELQALRIPFDASRGGSEVKVRIHSDIYFSNQRSCKDFRIRILGARTPGWRMLKLAVSLL